MKLIWPLFVMLMAGDVEKSDEPAPSPNSPSQEAKQEGLKQESEVSQYPHPLLKKLSSGEITVETDREGEQTFFSDAHLIKMKKKVSKLNSPEKKRSHFNPAAQEQGEDEEGKEESIS